MTAFSPIASLPITAVYPATGISGPVKFRFADRRFITDATDPDLPNTAFAPRVMSALSVDRSLPLAPGTDSRTTLQLGETVLANADGELDEFIRDYAVDGRAIEVKIGRSGSAYGGYDTLFKGTARGRKQASRTQVSFELRDATWELDIPVQRNLYAGSGALEGGGDLAGKPKPLSFGYVYNISATLVDAARLIYQVHDGQIGAISAVMDRGAVLSPAGDVADITTASPAAGTFVTQLSGGYFRLGANPAGLVTADVAGDASYGLFVAKTGEIAYRLIRDRGGFLDARIDALSFAVLNGLQPAPVGIWIGTAARSLTDVLNQLFGGINGWWGPNRLGIVECGRLDAPLPTAGAYLTVKDVLDYSFVPLPDAIDPPAWRFAVGAQPNWTIQDSDLAFSVTADRKLFLANGFRYQTWSDSNVQIRNLRSQDLVVPGLFAQASDALDEATRLGGLYSQQRSLIRIETRLQGYLRRMGETVNLNLPVGGLDGGRNMVVVGQKIDTGANQCFLDLFW